MRNLQKFQLTAKGFNQSSGGGWLRGRHDGVTRLDIGAQSFRGPQAVDGQQRDEGVLLDEASPAVTKSAPTSLRSRPVACDS